MSSSSIKPKAPIHPRPRLSARAKVLTALILALLLAASVVGGRIRVASDGFNLHDGDVVVFYGDSITDQRLYTTFVESYVVTRFPRLRVRFVHSGWGGDRVTGGGGGPIDTRLERDVIAYKPTVMTIMLGMNDGGYRLFDPELFRTYSTGYEHIIESVKKTLPGIRITVIQPSPYDDVTQPPKFAGGYNAVLVRYGEFLRELGERERLTVADLNAPLVAVLEKAKSVDPAQAQKIVPDRVHPAAAGHLIMAEALLKAWNAPATVTNVEIDGAERRVLRAEYTRVTTLEGTSQLAWTQEDGALPFPINLNDPVIALVVKSSDVVQALDQQALKVTGLTAARYKLSIDGEEVGVFSKEELERGINLAVLPTPMVKQAAAVSDLTVKHNTIHFARWRQLQVPLQGEQLTHLQAAYDALDALESDVVEKQRALSQPKACHYQLTPL